MGFIFHFKKNGHCHVTAFLEFFAITLLVVSLIITFVLNNPIGSQLVLLFGLSALGGGLGLLMYHMMKGKK